MRGTTSVPSSICRAAQPLLASLRTDENNAQIELDATSLRLNLGSALLGAGLLSEAATIFEENVNALRAIAQQGDSMQVQYLLAASEQGLGAIETRLAANAGSARAERLRRWQQAKEWFEAAIPRFQNVASRITLTQSDVIPMNEAISGLARSKEEIAKLQPGAPTPTPAADSPRTLPPLPGKTSPPSTRSTPR